MRYEVVFGMFKVYYVFGDILSVECFLKCVVLLVFNE